MPSSSLTGRTILITGASNGIGAEAARQLASQGASILAVGRDRERTAAIAQASGGRAFLADFGDEDSVRELAAQLLAHVDEIHGVLHNAGIFAATPSRSRHGHERTMQVNHLAPFLLQSELHERLAASAAHVVVTTSTQHRSATLDPATMFAVPSPYRLGAVSYARSKLANLLFVKSLAARAPQTGITAVAVHPGNVRTTLSSSAPALLNWLYTGPLGRPFTVDVATGARPLLHAATMTPARANGMYLHGLRENAPVSKLAASADLAEQVWRESERVLGLTPS